MVERKKLLWRKQGTQKKEKGEGGSAPKQAKRSRHTRTQVTDKTTNCQHTKAKHLHNNDKYGNEMAQGGIECKKK